MTTNRAEAAYALAELDRVVGATTLRHPSHGSSGGEWDALRSLPRRKLRRLTGARYLTPRGEAPDVLAEVIQLRTPAASTCEAIEWYAATALAAIGERRRIAARARRQRLAERHGYRTYHQYRTFQAVLEGHDTYRAKRHARGWNG